MPDELADLIDTAIYKEIESQALYIAGQQKTKDPAVRSLMAELAAEEMKHAQWLTVLKERGISAVEWPPDKVANLAISEYLTGGQSLESADIRDTLLFAIKREQQSVEFYSHLGHVLASQTAQAGTVGTGAQAQAGITL